MHFEITATFLKRVARDRISSIVIVEVLRSNVVFICVRKWVCMCVCAFVNVYFSVRSNGWFDHHPHTFGVVLWGMHKDIRLHIYLFIWDTYADYWSLYSNFTRGTFQTLKLYFALTFEYLVHQCQHPKWYINFCFIFITVELSFLYLYQIHRTSDKTFTFDVKLSF